MKRLLIALLVVLLVSPLALAAARTWTSNNGKYQVEAELIGVADGKVKLKKSDGKVVEVPLASLSEADQLFVKRQHEDDSTAEEAKKTPAAKPSPPNQDEEEPKAEDETPDSDDEAQEMHSDAQEIKLEPLQLDPPKKQSRGGAATLKSYLLQLSRPQNLIQLGKGDGANEANFKRIVKKEPHYVAPIPFRGVVKFGEREYAFALDAATAKSEGYDRLYFDANGDGDLTDDPKTTANSAKKLNDTTSMSQFPATRVTLNVGGESIEYAFLLNANCTLIKGNFRANVMVYSAVAREGYFMFGKKRMKIVLVDHNSNGRFDDAVSVQAGGRLVESDLLLIDPKTGGKTPALGAGNDLNMVGKTLCVGKTFYRLSVSPGGDKLKLEPMQIELGSVLCDNFNFRATLTSDDYGVVVLSGVKGQKAALAEGTWKLIGYTLVASEAGGRGAVLEASYGNNPPVVTVKKGETAALPFGSGFHAVVTASKGKDNKISLSLMIVGPVGEQCRQILVNGSRPPKPQFVIKGPNDKVVHQGNFEYG